MVDHKLFLVVAAFSFLFSSIVFGAEDKGAGYSYKNPETFVVSEDDCAVTVEVLPFGQNSSDMILTFEFSCDSSNNQRAKLLNVVLNKNKGRIDFSKIKAVKWKNIGQEKPRENLRQIFLNSQKWCDYTKSKKLFPYNIELIPEILREQDVFSEVRKVFENFGLHIVPDFVTNPLVRFTDEKKNTFASNKVCERPSFPTFVDIFYRVETLS